MLSEAGEMTRDAGASRTFRSIFGPSEGGGKGDEGDEAAWSDEGEREDNNEAAAAAAARQCGGSGARPVADWAEDEDDEELWKDALQARVNQLELALAPPPAAGPRHKLQRVALAASAASARKQRAGATDFIARNIQAVELARAGSGGSGSASSSRTDSPSSAGLRRKASAELAPSSPASAGTGAGSGREGRRSSRRASAGPVFDLSETEAIRRFVVSDIKQVRPRSYVCLCRRADRPTNRLRRCRWSGS